MSSDKSELTSTKECDYLDEDKKIRGQNYCLVSFISPENVLQDKEVYYLMKVISLVLQRRRLYLL